MESQTAGPHGHTYSEEDPHSVGLHSGEKKSVLKKVKAKAKKIKDTLRKHGHGHDHDYESEEEEEMVEDPEVHGAPVFESATTVIVAVPGQDVNLGQPKVNLEKPTVLKEDRCDAKMTDPPSRPLGEEAVHVPGDKHVSFPHETYGTRGNTGTSGDIVHAREENIGLLRVNVGKTDLEEDPHAPRGRREAFSDPSNYQTKVSDPTGTDGETVGITPLLDSFSKMNVYDESAPTPKLETGQVQHTGSHDQFSPEPIPTITPTTPGITESSPKRFDATETENVPRDNTLGSYTDKVSSATSAITDKAISAKNVIASKLGYGNKEDNRPPEMLHEKGETGNVASVGEYGHKITSAVGTEMGTEHRSGEEGADKRLSVKEYLAWKFRPSEEDRALSEVISGALHKPKEEPDEVEKAKAKPKPKPMGKVTESEEVARRLGTDNIEDTRNYKGDGVSGNMSTTKGVVGRLKGAVGTWFGKPSESQILQESLGTSYAGTGGFGSYANEGVAKGHEDGGQRRLEESAN